jgi:hypothetical protein
LGITILNEEEFMAMIQSVEQVSEPKIETPNVDNKPIQGTLF